MNTARAHTNIALIKYWGKQDEQLRLPLMSSLSMTLDAFYTDTSIEFADEDKFYLNGTLQTDASAQRVFTYIHKLQALLNLKPESVVIKSVNHVPTAAGLASSSSAFAALAGAFNRLYKLDLNHKQLSILARIGSGSASRSIFGGFSIWKKGITSDDSFAYPIDENPTMDLHLLAIELDTKPKSLSSTEGMKLAKTSPFFNHWLEANDSELDAMISAINNNDFTALGELAEHNANEMHAINLSAKPGFTYFVPETLKAIELIHTLRKNGIECYYTIDAGPNVKVLCQLKNVKDIQKYFVSEFNNVKIVSASFGPGISYLD